MSALARAAALSCAMGAFCVALACSSAERDTTKMPSATDRGESPRARQPTPTMEMLLRGKLTDDDFKAGIAMLSQADAEADVESALEGGDRRLLAVEDFTLLTPGYAGDRRQLPDGVSIATVAGTSGRAGNKHQQRFQYLATRYAKEYNTLLLQRVMKAAGSS